jgi:type IV secretory pathway VirB3-like protein
MVDGQVTSDPEPSINQGWPRRTHLRVIQQQSKRGLILMAFFVLLIIALMTPFQGSEPPLGLMIGLVILFILALLSHFWIMFLLVLASVWKCPRCGNCFTWKGLACNPFASHCLHCGVWREEV